MLNQVAVVSETGLIPFNILGLVAAAIQKQVSRDVAPLWNLEASVDAFASLDDVPLGYWQVIIDEDIPFPGTGIHLNEDNGQPFALVKFTENWSLTTSHEVVEMLIDPSGNRTVATNSPKDDQGRVLILLEPCDPTEAPKFGYTVNGILVSDFYTPRYFDPVFSPGVQYSFTGAITKPREVLDGGYLSWWEPESGHVFQLNVDGRKKEFVDLGTLPPGFVTLRSFADSKSNERRAKLKPEIPKKAMLTAKLPGIKTEALAKASRVDRSTHANAASLRSQIRKLVKKHT